MNKETLKGLAIFTLMVALAILTAVVSANAQSRNRVSANTYKTIEVVALPH
jgi:hypothetical protein